MNEINKITEQDALSLIAEILNEEPSEVELDSDLNALEGWDSMGVLLLMAEMDERFGLTITETQFEAMEHPSDIVDILRANDLVKN